MVEEVKEEAKVVEEEVKVEEIVVVEKVEEAKPDVKKEKK